MKCSVCKKFKPRVSFYKCKSLYKGRGYFGYCKSCSRAKSNKYNKANKKKHRKHNRDYVKRHPTRIQTYRRKHYRLNKRAILAASIQWQTKHPIKEKRRLLAGHLLRKYNLTLEDYKTMRTEDSLGDRMKRYEASSHYQLPPRSCCIIRCDGRAFHSFNSLKKPFDQGFINAMVSSAVLAYEDMQGFKLAYTQSDEVSFLLTDFDTIQTQGWFGYDLAKVVSTSASLMSVHFNSLFRLMEGQTLKLATFDSRAFVIPKTDVANYFLWRARDWERNSLQMYSRSFFNKGREDMHEMLHSVGKNWATDLTPQLKNGTFITKIGQLYTQPSYEEINRLVESHLEENHEPTTPVKS